MASSFTFLRTRVPLAVGALAAALALSACGSGSSGSQVASGGGSRTPSAGSSQKSSDPQQARLQYAACMRSKGIDMPDPGANGTQVQVPSNPAKFEAAANACQHFLPNATGEGAGGYSAAQRAQDLKLAQCLRSKGVDAQDPTADGKMNIPDGDSQKTQDALKACGGGTVQGKAGQ
ncbi:hypothetical protein [Streptacidiphilus griseoplanus]|uniref:hypothetical protein n=1 Tax=Peterkaempfera griseoplana TaxID=66896 RepID=UPI000A7BCA22|nr:hypothetical protein [Peterkaempfera griseoplana]